MPVYETLTDQTPRRFDAAFARLTGRRRLPGRSTRRAATIRSRATAATRADTLVTPMNDSFVDFDLIGQVDPETYKVTRPSFYSELIWDARKARAKADGVTIDWVVLRNRLQHIEARNMRRVSEALDQLAKRVGFRIIPGLGERVIYRELFPKGLTMIDSQGIRRDGAGACRRAAGIARDDGRAGAARARACRCSQPDGENRSSSSSCAGACGWS